MKLIPSTLQLLMAHRFRIPIKNGLEQFLAVVTQAQATPRDSIQDAPNVEVYGKVDIDALVKGVESFPLDYEEDMEFYLTIGAEGVKSIKLTMPYSSGGCENADGSLFKKVERIWLENLDGYSDLRGLTITALDKNGEVVWSASIPNEEENEGFTHLKNDDWEITNIE